MPQTLRPLPSYQPRIVDVELDELLDALPALSLEGAKGVGKTATAGRRGGSMIPLDHPATFELVTADPGRLLRGTTPIVVDEWQRYPASWDLVRRAVDQDPSPGRFLLTGSATPKSRPTHSGAGRIVPIRMRPLTLAERGLEVPTVSLTKMLAGDREPLAGSTAVTLGDYTTEILTGGFPGMRHERQRAQRAALDGYLERIIDTDLPELGIGVRNPSSVRRWVRAYAAATATSTSYDRIRDAATGGEADKPAKTTTIGYRDALERVWMLDPVPAWTPSSNRLGRLAAAPKHHLADPALAARLAGVDARALLEGHGPDLVPRDGTFLGALFESLAALSLRVFAQAGEAAVAHFRDRNGRHDVDYIVERGDGRVVAAEVKLSATVDDNAVRHLLWLRDRIGDMLLDAMVITTGPHAYRRPDGVAVVPLALLGP